MCKEEKEKLKKNIKKMKIRDKLMAVNKTSVK